MALHWVRVKDELLTDINPDATRLADGHGVWEQTSRGNYKYTWYTYGIGAENSNPLFSVRVSGTAMNMAEGDVNACDFIVIYYTYEIFDGFILPQYMPNQGDTDYNPFIIEGAAGELRAPLTVVPPTTE